MPYNPDIHHRRSIRLKGYDYSQAGLYFVTICVQNKECVFGEIVDGKMNLSPLGIIVDVLWHEIKNHANNIDLCEYTVMPNHIHGIIMLLGDDNTNIEMRCDGDGNGNGDGDGGVGARHALPLRRRPNNASTNIPNEWGKRNNQHNRGFKIRAKIRYHPLSVHTNLPCRNTHIDWV
ncbi:MAG: hypothetical protein LBG15_04780 [Dysgonamonadaceae bacterium]|jgi:hypothetical protein|nr:hypothetical protein [Dysgonamonadaceae bacterium]